MGGRESGGRVIEAAGWARCHLQDDGIARAGGICSCPPFGPCELAAMPHMPLPVYRPPQSLITAPDQVAGIRLHAQQAASRGGQALPLGGHVVGRVSLLPLALAAAAGSGQRGHRGDLREGEKAEWLEWSSGRLCTAGLSKYVWACYKPHAQTALTSTLCPPSATCSAHPCGGADAARRGCCPQLCLHEQVDGSRCRGEAGGGAGGGSGQEHVRDLRRRGGVAGAAGVVVWGGGRPASTLAQIPSLCCPQQFHTAALPPCPANQPGAASAPPCRRGGCPSVPAGGPGQQPAPGKAGIEQQVTQSNYCTS